MKYINKIGMTVVAGAMLAATSCSDYADYNTAPGISDASAGKTLYENIASNPQLQDFAAIIAKAGVADMLNASQSYTLWAPVDGTYDKDAILSLPDSSIQLQFINQHMAQYMHPVSGKVNERIISLNDKHHTFTDTDFDGNSLVAKNLPSSNGIMHLISGQATYHTNIYEHVAELQGCDSIKNYISKYDVYHIDRSKSVEGPLVNGKQTYLDTVLVKSNAVIKSMMNAELANEDSSYTVLFPTNEAWKEALNSIKPYYNYKKGFSWMHITNEFSEPQATTGKKTPEQIQKTAVSPKAVDFDLALWKDSIPKRHIIWNLAFSNNDPYNKPLLTGSYSTDTNNADSLRSTNGKKLSNVAEIFAAMGNKESRSNGQTFTFDRFPYLPNESYSPVISVNIDPNSRNTDLCRSLNIKKENDKFQKPNKYTKLISEFLATRDTLFSKNPDERFRCPDFIKRLMMPKNARFMSYTSFDSVQIVGASTRPELDFKLTNTLSTKYHIFVVMMPVQIEQPEHPVYTKGQYLRFDLAYNDADGKQQWYRLNIKGAKKSTDDIIIPSNYINVIEMEFEFPLSYYGLTQEIDNETVSVAPTLFITDSETAKYSSSSYRRQYDRDLRIGGIFMIPDNVYEYYKNQKF